MNKQGLEGNKDVKRESIYKAALINQASLDEKKDKNELSASDDDEDDDNSNNNNKKGATFGFNFGSDKNMKKKSKFNE